MSCRHKHIVLVGNDETGLRATRCADCRAPLTRRIERGVYVYFASSDAPKGNNHGRI